MDMTQNLILCMKKLILDHVYVAKFQFKHFYYIQ